MATGSVSSGSAAMRSIRKPAWQRKVSGAFFGSVGATRGKGVSTSAANVAARVTATTRRIGIALLTLASEYDLRLSPMLSYHHRRDGKVPPVPSPGFLARQAKTPMRAPGALVY